MKIGTNEKNKKSYKPNPLEVIYGVSKDACKSCKDFGGSFLVTVTVPYVIPKFVRIMSGPEEDSQSPNIANYIGLYTGMVGWVAQAVFYASNPEYVLLPVAINALDLGYEKLYRPKKIEIIEKHKDEMVDKIKN